jgi:hypothetical protein
LGEKIKQNYLKHKTWTYKIKCLCTLNEKHNFITLLLVTTLQTNPVPLTHKDGEGKQKQKEK